MDERKRRMPEYIGSKYIQHNPTAADGIEGVADYLENLEKTVGRSTMHLKRSAAQGDLVFLHSHYLIGEKDERGVAAVDIFRFEDGKIVEHWDVMQPVAEESLNDNTMF